MSTPLVRVTVVVVKPDGTEVPVDMKGRTILSTEDAVEWVAHEMERTHPELRGQRVDVIFEEASLRAIRPVH